MSTPPFSREEYARRTALARASMSTRGIDALVLRNPENICYLTGYETPGHYNFHALIVMPDAFAMVVRLFESPNVEEYTNFKTVFCVPDGIVPVTVLVDALKTLGLADKRLGLETGINKASLYSPVSEREILTRDLPRANFVDCTGILAAARVLKSDVEIEALRTAVNMAEIAVDAGIEAITDGCTENDIAAAVLYAGTKAGCEYVSLPPFVAAGERSAIPHGTWRGRSVARGEHVYFEVSGVHKRYTGPVMRCATLGPPSDLIQKMSDAMLRALDVSLEGIRPGMSGKSAHDLIYNVVDEAGFGGDYFTHHGGYSLGIAFPPGWGEGHLMDIGPGEEKPLQPGMVFHIVPVSLIYGTAGVGFSAVVQITETGCVPLSRYPRALTVV
ncbi:peptidase M24 [Acuticoccus sediminis]|uniref:Peptidase M24 n=1 Tax=Acuticoccus sediminis TaxID=2184697 RepID=A0A8B2NNA3_9HYPH|nr:Xaa-Pro peptidase family protein [Acuticoccus sediminis]RAH95785.1 peptidase M24 [Acuticoccus sediminis]